MDKPWWPEFPNLRREIDRLLPLIREPHWTDWSVSIPGSSSLVVGTRELNGTGCLLVLNDTDKSCRTTIKVDRLSYEIGSVVDYFSGKEVAKASNNSFVVVHCDSVNTALAGKLRIPMNFPVAGSPG